MKTSSWQIGNKMLVVNVTKTCGGAIVGDAIITVDEKNLKLLISAPRRVPISRTVRGIFLHRPIVTVTLMDGQGLRIGDAITVFISGKRSKVHVSAPLSIKISRGIDIGTETRK